MSMNAKEVPYEGSKMRAEPLEAGAYPCRVVQVMVLGTQKQRPYMGEEKPPAREIMITYEFLDEFMKDEDGNEIEDKPRWLSETMPFHNLEAEKAKSTKRYLALDPELMHDGDWSKIVGTPCMVNVVNNEGKGKHAGKIFENVGGVSAMREKDAKKAPDLVNGYVLFDFYDPDPEVWEGLQDWLKDKMKEAVDFEGSALQEMLDNSGDNSGNTKEEEW